MAKGYVIFTEKIKDEAAMGEYGQAAMPTMFAAGGSVIVAAPAEVLEGKWHGDRTVILEFASVAAARNWYNSADYQAAIGLRHAAADSNIAIVEGFEMPS